MATRLRYTVKSVARDFRGAALCLLLAGCGGCISVPPVGDLPRIAFQLGLEKGSCTGTAVSAHWVLTAAHCLYLGGQLVKVDGEPVEMLDVIFDEHDHALVKVNRTFRDWAPMVKPHIGERVRMLGNPEGFKAVYRVGMVSAIGEQAECQNAPGMSLKSCTVILFQMVTGGGDSGGGYFSDSGELVAVHTGTYPIGNAGMGFAFPLAFTAEQLRAAT